MLKSHPLSFVLMLLVAASLFAATGCQTFTRKPVQKEIAPGTPQFMLSVKGEGWGSGVDMRAELKENMTIDDVLTEHDLKRKFKNMDIQIIRQVPESGQLVKMPVVFKAGMKRVKAEQNYAIHANDNVIVKQVVQTALDKLVDQLAPNALK